MLMLTISKIYRVAPHPDMVLERVRAHVEV